MDDAEEYELRKWWPIPNATKPPRDSIENCLQSLTNIVALVPSLGGGLVELTEKATAMARAELATLQEDAGKWREHVKSERLTFYSLGHRFPGDPCYDCNARKCLVCLKFNCSQDGRCNAPELKDNDDA